jgi:hypothetical protein
VYVRGNRIAAGEACFQIAPNATNVQLADSECRVNGTLNGGGRTSGVELGFGSSGNNLAKQWVRNVYVSGVAFVGDMDAVAFKSGANREIEVEVSNATFADLKLSQVRRPVFLGEGYFGDNGCGRERCTKWNVTGVVLKGFKGGAAEHAALVCETVGDVCEFKVEGWEVTYS